MPQNPAPAGPTLFLGDIHRHLTAEQDFAYTIDPVLYCSTRPEQWPQIQKLTKAPGGYGIHPWEVTAQTYPDLQKQITALPALLPSGPSSSSPGQPLILGEIGLDFSGRHQAHKVWQRKIFEQFLALPWTGPRILNLHLVRAWHEVLHSSLKDQLFTPLNPTKIILHAFQGSREILRQLLTFPQVFFSYGLKHGASDECLKEIPLHRLFIESDLVDPTPPPQIEQILQTTLGHLAHVQGQTPAQVGRQLQANWIALFKV